MIDQISDYFNRNPYIAVALIVLALVVLWSLYNRCNKSEHMESVQSQTIIKPVSQPAPVSSDTSDTLGNLPRCDPNTDQVFYKEFTGASKMINFQCTYNGKDYYLANVKISDCSNISAEEANKSTECTSVALVLLDKADVDTQLNSYSIDISNDSKLCNFTKNLQCTSHTTNQEECNVGHPECASHRFFNNDFVVTEIIQQPTTSNIPPRRKYIIKGTATPLRNGVSFASMLNQHVYDEQGVNVLCGDDYAYGSDPSKNRYAEVIVVEKPTTSSSSIIGNNSTQTVNLVMHTQAFIEGVDKTTGAKTINKLYDVGNNPKMMVSFVSASPDKVCTLNGRQYQRVCLQGDQLSPTILNFKPVLVGTAP